MITDREIAFMHVFLYREFVVYRTTEIVILSSQNGLTSC